MYMYMMHSFSKLISNRLTDTVGISRFFLLLFCVFLGGLDENLLDHLLKNRFTILVLGGVPCSFYKQRMTLMGTEEPSVKVKSADAVVRHGKMFVSVEIIGTSVICKLKV
ncbi:hypothetical protein P9112_011188 [Eukaryota sp. TZLM1-RC]